MSRKGKKQKKKQTSLNPSQIGLGNSSSKSKIDTRVDVILPIFNGAEFLGPLLSDFLNSDYQNSWRLWLADDGSPDPIIQQLGRTASQDPRIKYYRNSQQLQFARNCNQAAKRGKAEYICLLNSDIKLAEPNWLDLLVRELDTKEDVGMTAPMLLFFPDNDQFGPRGTIQSVGFAYNHQLLPWHRFIGWDPNHPRANKYCDELQGATGACLLIRRTLWEKIGGFNEEYISTFEDAELGIGVKQAGFKISVLPDARLYHRVGGSNAQSNILLNRNAGMFLNRVGEFVRYDEHELL